MISPDRKKMVAVRSEFIAALGAEYMLETGYGVYAHLSHTDINGLFEQFLVQASTAKAFSKKTVKNLK